METNTVSDISSPIPYLQKFEFLSYRPKCCQLNKLQDFLKCNIARKKWMVKFIFCRQINMKVSYRLISTLLASKLSYKVILWILMGMIKHSRSTQSNQFAMSLQYLKKRSWEWSSFLHGDKSQSFYKLALLFLMEVVRHVQSTENRKLVTFLRYIKKKLLQLLLCSIVMQNIQIFYGSPVMLLVVVFFTERLKELGKFCYLG